MLIKELLDKYSIETPKCLLYYKGILVDYINEYTLRNIQLGIKKGELNKEDFRFEYENEYYTIIDDAGNLNKPIPNVMDMSYQLTKERIF